MAYKVLGLQQWIRWGVTFPGGRLFCKITVHLNRMHYLASTMA